MLGRQRSEDMAERLESGRRSFGSIVWRRFRANRTASGSLRILYILVFLAVFGDFIANEKPLYCRVEGQVYFPVFRQYAVDLGLAEWEARFVQTGWSELEYEKVLFPPIPYSAHTLDHRNMNYVSPLEEQQVDSWRRRHWLGTDRSGRDALAGMIRGTRIALSVGVVAMGVATFIGLLLGSLGGFFGDHGLRISYARLVLNLVGLGLGLFYAFVSRSYALSEVPFLWELLKSLGILFGMLLLVNILSSPARRLPWLGRRFDFPTDLLVMRLIELFNAIPGLLLILSVVAIVRQSNIFHIMVIIGLISWTSVARFVRAELLRIRRLSYIEAARALGYSRRRTLIRHALPNALPPVLITIAFGIAASILLEALLSFLGVGLPPDSVTWGTMLNQARSAPGAWWLAVFPGLAIFVTVTLFNLIGEGLSEALEPAKGEG